jgi:hypothetical protein
MPDDAMFAPLGSENTADAAPTASATARKLTPIIPVPDDAPSICWRHPRHGEPVALWPYHLLDARLVGYSARVEYFEDGEHRKDVLPITYCRVNHDKGDYYAWRACGVPAPRPLYRLPELISSPARLVVVVEGEKKADLVPRLFPGYVGTTSMGGAHAAKLSDWSLLAGCAVIIWPDRDEPGRCYAEAVAALAIAAGATSVRIVTVPEDWPEGWDLADPLPAGIGPKKLVALLGSAMLGRCRSPRPSGLSFPLILIGWTRRGYSWNSTSPKSRSCGSPRLSRFSRTPAMPRATPGGSCCGGAISMVACTNGRCRSRHSAAGARRYGANCLTAAFRSPRQSRAATGSPNISPLCRSAAGRAPCRGWAGTPRAMALCSSCQTEPIKRQGTSAFCCSRRRASRRPTMSPARSRTGAMPWPAGVSATRGWSSLFQPDLRRRCCGSQMRRMAGFTSSARAASERPPFCVPLEASGAAGASVGICGLGAQHQTDWRVSPRRIATHCCALMRWAKWKPERRGRGCLRAGERLRQGAGTP